MVGTPHECLSSQTRLNAPGRPPRLASSSTAQGTTHRSRADRVSVLRAFYEQSATDLTSLIGHLPGRTLTDNHRRRWVDEPYAALEAYALTEGLW